MNRLARIALLPLAGIEQGFGRKWNRDGNGHVGHDAALVGALVGYLFAFYLVARRELLPDQKRHQQIGPDGLGQANRQALLRLVKLVQEVAHVGLPSAWGVLLQVSILVWLVWPVWAIAGLRRLGCGGFGCGFIGSLQRKTMLGQHGRDNGSDLDLGLPHASAGAEQGIQFNQ